MIAVVTIRRRIATTNQVFYGILAMAVAGEGPVWLAVST